MLCAFFCGLYSVAEVPTYDDLRAIYQQTSPPKRSAIDASETGKTALFANDQSRALKFLERACDGNDPDGCFYLGGLLSLDNGQFKDFQKASKAFQKGCGLGQLDACGSVGYNMRFGYQGYEADRDRAEAYLWASCDAGNRNPDACALAAEYVRNNSDRRTELAKTREILETACDADEGDFSRACFAFVEYLEHGVGGEDPFPKGASEFYLKSCEQAESSWGCYRYGVVALRNGDYYRRGDDHRTDARRAFDRACDLDLAAACAARVNMDASATSSYGSGEGVDIESSQETAVVTAADAACALDHPDGCFWSGVFSSIGLGGRPTIEAARENYEQSCELGHYNACLVLKNFLESGVGGPIDSERASIIENDTCFGELDTLTCMFSAFTVSDFLFDDRVIEKVALTAFPGHEAACQGGNVSRCFKSLWYFEAASNTDQQNSDIYIKRVFSNSMDACEANETSSFMCLFIISSSLNDEDLSEVDQARAIALFERYKKDYTAACFERDVASCMNLFVVADTVYDDAYTSYIRDRVLPFMIDVAKNACAEGDSYACYILASLESLGGELRIKLDTDAARERHFEALKGACNGGIILICEAYADALFKGEYGEKDVFLALDLFDRNCRNGISSRGCRR
ncbi:MAG: tetratricopeptide repeat protein [Pseudomonadota bacterium]